MKCRTVWPAILLAGVFLSFPSDVAAQHDPASAEHPLHDLAILEGSWAGEIDGTIGSGTGHRQYRFILRDRFLLMTHASYRAPQELAPQGDAHEEWSIFSFDTERDVIVLRSFVVEGFVIRYTCVIETEPLRLTCESEAAEGGSELFLREAYEFTDLDHFTEIFEIFGPDGTLQVRFENQWLRTSERN
jgi:hypothetical protein